MKAIVIKKYGASEVLEVNDVPKPIIKDDQLLVRQMATSVNPVDWKIRAGKFKVFTGIRLPKMGILGADVAGEIVEVGKDIKHFRKGDRIFAMVNTLTGGAYAEFVSVPESFAATKPVNMSFEESAAVPLAALTALQALRDKAKIRSGAKVLINGASGGVGIFAVQIAKALGADVTAVCSTKNLELVRSVGADNVIDYTKEDFTRNNQQYDIVFDVVANQSFSQCKNILKSKGIYVTTVPTLSVISQIFWTSFWPGRKAAFFSVKPSSKDLNFLRELIEAGKIKSVIDQSYPFSQVSTAHNHSETGHVKGKIVLTF